jgi:hypothetical protein
MHPRGRLRFVFLHYTDLLFTDSWVAMVPERLVALFYELLADFTEDAIPEVSQNDDEPLSVRRLKNNINRFSEQFHHSSFL